MRTEGQRRAVHVACLAPDSPKVAAALPHDASSPERACLRCHLGFRSAGEAGAVPIVGRTAGSPSVGKQPEKDDGDRALESLGEAAG